MIEISFLTGELIFAAAWLIVRAIVWIARRRIDLKRELILLIMYINLAVILRFTFFPMERVDGRVQPLIFDPDAIIPFNLNLIPFNKLFWCEDTKMVLMNLFGNILMFIPTGIILPIIYKWVDRLYKALLIGALISLTIELMQLPFYVRMTDTNDLILNTLGVLIGYGIYLLVRCFRFGRGNTTEPNVAKNSINSD